MPRRRVHNTPAEQLQFEEDCIVGLWEAGWTYQQIAAHVGHNVGLTVVCRCFQQWSVEHSHTRRPGSGRPRNTDARQDRRIVPTAVAASMKEIRAHVASAVSPRPLVTVLLQPLWFS